MAIRSFIHSNHQCVSVNEKLTGVIERLSIEDYLIVTKDGEPTGILTLKDIDSHQHKLVEDCSYQKPHVNPEQTVNEVVGLLLDSGNAYLPVFENHDFIGVISLSALSRDLLNRLEAAEQNFQHIAHDLRNPLANIAGIMELLSKAKSTPDDMVLTNLGKMECTNAIGMLDDLLDVEKIQHQKMEQEGVEINHFIRSCYEELRGTAFRKQTRFQFVPLAETCFVTVDKKHLKRAVCNLLSNAIKFTPNQGEVVLTLEKYEDNFILRISDNGIGIPEELQPYIFDRFTKAARPGTAGERPTGLGLFLVRETINRLGGHLFVESAELQGTTFILTLPLHSTCDPS